MEVYGKENILRTPDRTETSMPSSVSNKPAPMRPLTAAYQASRSDHQVLVSHKIHSDFLKCNLNPRVTNISFLLTLSKHHQEEKLMRINKMITKAKML